MGLIRVIVFGLAIWLLYKFYMAYKSRIRALDNNPVDGGSIVKCSQCGEYLPKSKSITSGAQHFCCSAHQKEYESNKNDES